MVSVRIESWFITIKLSLIKWLLALNLLRSVRRKMGGKRRIFEAKLIEYNQISCLNLSFACNVLREARMYMMSFILFAPKE